MSQIKKQYQTITQFCKDASYYMVQFSTTPEEFGKIITNKELKALELERNEIYRSINSNNGNRLFVLDLLPQEKMYVSNPMQLLLQTLNDARTIELTYPNIFTWAFNGLNIVAYAIVPSGNMKANTTITRYGGTENFMRILKKHLINIIKIQKDKAPDYDFTGLTEPVRQEELSIGSINKRTDLYSVQIELKSSYNKILKQSKLCKNLTYEPSVLEMKYWAREINPDFIVEAKHIKLKNTISIDEGIKLYPAPILRLMSLEHKGNYYRYILARFLLSVHSPKEAKFIFYSVLGNGEYKHIKEGNCANQWRYIRNNMDKYSCPSMKELSNFIEEGDEKLSHPLEGIQEFLENEQKRNGTGNKEVIEKK